MTTAWMVLRLAVVRAAYHPMNDLKDRLNNRTDLEKLEQDLEVIERLVNEGSVGDKIKKRAQQARRDLEAARSAHTELVLRLTDPLPARRKAARQEVDQRIAAGEIKLFDPRSRNWRPARDLLIEALAFEERQQGQSTETRQIEFELAEAARRPQNFYNMHQLILRAEDLLSQGGLSQNGKEALAAARGVYESGCKRQRELTLNIHNGTLKERFDALGQIRDLITTGKSQILDAPEEIWRPAEEILAIAEQACVNESARLSDEALAQAEMMAQTNIKAALRDLYLALDLSIPYINSDRARLKVKYNELRQLYQQNSSNLPPPVEVGQVSAEDMAGFQAVRALYQERLKKILNQSPQWLYQFSKSALTLPVAKLLIEAEKDSTPPARTVELIDMAIGLARNAMEESIEIPEAMIRGAVILLNKGIPQRARSLLIEAFPLYTLESPEKIHRRAVTAWLLGCVEYFLGNRAAGYEQWKTAYGLFDGLLTLAVKEKQIEKENWYHEKLKEMSAYAIQTFEAVYLQWMNQFDMINLPQSLRTFRSLMDQQLASDQINPLRKTITRYLKASKAEPIVDIHWEALVDAAFYEYEIKDYLSALEHLNQAWVGFQATHRGAVVLWLSGIIQWWLPSKNEDAVRNWETSIRIFRTLSNEADKQNRISQHAWYDGRIDLMTTSLNEWIQLTKAG